MNDFDDIPDFEGTLDYEERVTTGIPVRARRTDPKTSHMAAAEFEASGQQQLSVKTVVDILKDRGAPMTDFNISAMWHKYWPRPKWSHSLPAKARLWARQAGLVRHAGYGLHGPRTVMSWELGRDEAFLKRMGDVTESVERLARELHRARVLLQRCDQWFEEGPEMDRPVMLSQEIKDELRRQGER